MSKIKDGMVKLGKGRIEIPDTDRGDIPDFFVEMGYKVGAEVGVYKGTYTKQFLDKGLKMYAIDPWLCYEDYDEKRGKFQDKQDRLYNAAMETLEPYVGKSCEIIRKTSMEAIKEFADDSLDFIYIDGHHGFKFIAEDIWEWSKKIRVGGIISGHDYGILSEKRPWQDPYNCHVKYVVDAYTLALGIKDWYVLGRSKPVEGEKRDGWRSWFWVKEQI